MRHEGFRRVLVFGIVTLVVVIGTVQSMGSSISTFNGTSSFAKTLYVGGSGPNNYTRIQDAIDNANDGDTVFVYNGTYCENIFVDKSIVLKGEDKNNTIIDGKNKRDTVEIHNTTDVVLTGFKIIGSGDMSSGVLIANSNGCDINENIISDNHGEGIKILGEENKIWGNIIEANSQDGIVVGGKDNIIEENKIYQNGVEAEPWTGDGIHVHTWSEGIKIHNNTIEQNDADGVFIDEFSANHIISGNSILKNGKWGIVLFNCDGVTCRYNFIAENAVGIHMAFCKGSIIEKNTITRNEVNLEILTVTRPNNYVQNNNIYYAAKIDARASFSCVLAPSNYWGHMLGPLDPRVRIVRKFAIFIVFPWSTIEIPDAPSRSSHCV